MPLANRFVRVDVGRGPFRPKALPKFLAGIAVTGFVVWLGGFGGRNGTFGDAILRFAWADISKRISRGSGGFCRATCFNVRSSGCRVSVS